MKVAKTNVPQKPTNPCKSRIGKGSFGMWVEEIKRHLLGWVVQKAAMPTRRKPRATDCIYAPSHHLC